MKEIQPKNEWRAHRFFKTRVEEIFFEITKKEILKKFNNSLADYIENVAHQSDKKGILYFDTIEENKSFKIGFDPKSISKKEVEKFVESLEL